MKCASLFTLLIALILPALSLHCAILDNDEQDTLNISQAVARASCGPTDGQAFFVYITEEVSSCNTLDSFLSTFPKEQAELQFFLFGETSPVIPSTILLDEEGTISYSAGGLATRCNPLDCENSERGTVTFEPTSDADAKMTYDVRFEDGSRETGEVEVQVCPLMQPLLCG